MKFDHIGIVVESIKKSRAIFERDLPGFSSSKIYIDKEKNRLIKHCVYKHGYRKVLNLYTRLATKKEENEKYIKKVKRWKKAREAKRSKKS